MKLPKGPYVVTIGTISHVKGTYDTLRSLVSTPYALVQAGGGSAEEKAALVAEGKRLGVDVFCMPRLSQAALVGVVRGAHAMVSHAHHEPFGFTPLEAMETTGFLGKMGTIRLSAAMAGTRFSATMAMTGWLVTGCGSLPILPVPVPERRACRMPTGYLAGTAMTI